MKHVVVGAVVVMLALLGAACVRTPVVEPVAAPPPTSAEPEPGPPLWSWTLLPPADEGAEVIGDPANFTWRNGGRRVSAEDRQIRVADQFPTSSFVQATRIGSAWLFLTHAGGLYHSGDFTGELTYLDTRVAPCAAIGGDAQAAYCVDGEHALWRAPLAASLVFAKIAADVSSVAPLGGDVLVTGTDGAVRRLGPAGQLVRTVDTAGACVRSVFERGGWAWMETNRGQVLPYEKAGAQVDTPQSLQRISQVATEVQVLASRAFAARFEATALAQEWSGKEPRREECRHAPGEGRRLRVCRADEDVLRIEVGEGATWTSVSELLSDGSSMEVAFDPRDAVAVAVAGQCEVDPEATPNRSVCWRTARSHKTVKLTALAADEPPDAPPSILRLYALSGSLLHGRLDGAHTLWDLARGGLRLPLPEERRVAGPWLHDGVALVVVRAGDSLALATITAAGMTRLPLPGGATAVAFATRERGIAVGAHAGQVWATSDGGRRWTPAAVPAAGDLSQWKIGAPRCSPRACFAWPHAWSEPGLVAQSRAAVYVAPTRAHGKLPKDARRPPCAEIADPHAPVNRYYRNRKTALVDLTSAYGRGDPDAAATLIVFCEFAAGFEEDDLTTLAFLRKRFGRNLRIVFQHYPRDGVPHEATRAAEAAGQQGKFWEMHDALHGDNGGDIQPLAARLGLDLQRFARDMRDPALEQKIRRQAALPGALGLDLPNPLYFVDGTLVEPDNLSHTIAAAIERAEDEPRDAATDDPPGTLYGSRHCPTCQYRVRHGFPEIKE